MRDMMNCFIDTNLLVYAVDPGDPAKQFIAQDLLRETISKDMLVLSPQSLIELFRSLTRQRLNKPGLVERTMAEAYVARLRPNCRAVLDVHTVTSAIRLHATYQTQWFDSVLLAAALGSACQVFWSEDMQHDQIIDGMRIINPFKVAPADVLA
jgi:predicted nucleic acid-binding protein